MKELLMRTPILEKLASKASQRGLNAAVPAPYPCLILPDKIIPGKVILGQTRRTFICNIAWRVTDHCFTLLAYKLKRMCNTAVAYLVQSQAEPQSLRGSRRN